MSIKSLERAFGRLLVRPSSLCKECRRSLATSPRVSQQRSATASIAEMMENNKTTDAGQDRQARVLNATTSRGAPSSTPNASTAQGLTGFEFAGMAVRQATMTRAERDRQQQARDLARNFSRKDLEQQMSRRWKPGDVYAPHDLSGVEMAKWKKTNKKPKTRYDVMDQLGINPLHHYKNVSIMSEYMTEMGRIKHNSHTGLRPINQRRMAKAIRRAIGIGLMPGVHRHPEILRLEMEERESRR